jgi:hypothetical protein
MDKMAATRAENPGGPGVAGSPQSPVPGVERISDEQLRAAARVLEAQRHKNLGEPDPEPQGKSPPSRKGE